MLLCPAMKLRERVLVAILCGVTLLTVFLVLDVETSLTKAYKGVPSHAKVQYSSSFRHRNLQKTINGSREGSSIQHSTAEEGVVHPGGVVPPPEGVKPHTEGAGGAAQSENDINGGGEVDVGDDGSGKKEVGKVSSPPPVGPKDPYEDLWRIVKKGKFIVKGSKKKKWNPTMGDILGIDLAPNASLWDKFHLGISRERLYPRNAEVIDKLLQYIPSAPVEEMAQQAGGTQLKLTLILEDGGHVLLKPMRFQRDEQTHKNHFYFTDYERHNAEISAYHLDRLLGFNRAVPVVGRLMNMTKELYALAQGDLLKTFFISPDNNLCFHGQCSYYCDTSHAICGNPDMLEVSLATYLPGKTAAPRKAWRHPWRRSYHKRRKAQWEVDDEYCELVKEVHPYTHGRRLIDLMDMAILDFLMGNMDRHHYETFKMFGNNSAPVHLDHGRAFGKPYHDELSILAPLYQCCLIRHSTLDTLLRLHNSKGGLSLALRESLKLDPLNPVLWEPHLEAQDRRLNMILKLVRECTEKVPDPFDVVINDGH